MYKILYKEIKPEKQLQCLCKDLRKYSRKYLRNCALLHTCALAQVLVYLRNHALTDLRTCALPHLRTCALVHLLASTCALTSKYLRTCSNTCELAHLCTSILTHLHKYLRTCAFTHLRTGLLYFCQMEPHSEGPVKILASLYVGLMLCMWRWPNIKQIWIDVLCLNGIATVSLFVKCSI